MTDNEAQSVHRQKNSRVGFVTFKVAPILIFGGAIPFAFILVTVLQLELISTKAADGIVSRLEALWPVLRENYDRMISVGRTRDAKNHALFFAVMLGLGILSVALLIRQYARRSTGLDSSDTVAVATLVGFGAITYAGLSHLDHVRFELISIHSFYLDDIGLYFVRHYLVLALIYYAALILVASVLNVILRPRKSLQNP
jgi:hypothetical protein